MTSIETRKLQAGRFHSAGPATRHTEGLVHGFLALRTLDGDLIGDGDLIQVAHGDRVTSRLVFHFKDGSINDETTVFSQRQQFRLISDHLVQSGHTFTRPLDLSIDMASGHVNRGTHNSTPFELEISPRTASSVSLTTILTTIMS
jgi:hypothetical protein